MKFWDDSRTLEQVLATPCKWDALLQKRPAPTTAEIIAELKFREAEDSAGINQRKNNPMQGAEQWHLQQAERWDKRKLRIREEGSALINDNNMDLSFIDQEIEDAQWWKEAELRNALEAEVGTLPSIVQELRSS